MKCLLIIAHGSRREASNDEVRNLSRIIEEKAGTNFDIVDTAFLELAEPSIPDGIHSCIEKGANEIYILPYFLSAGRHVAEDIPNELSEVEGSYPDVHIHLMPYLGSLESIPGIIVEQATRQFDEKS